ncbi:hypothetical protein GCM10022239_10420 [Leifsonia bigeumensis]|uniref:DUF1206 domain-containing protein n=1 Tax=Leifsonella bigeumensis TaxID=433643 RepID=A0ABP7FCS1_9MICO
MTDTTEFATTDDTGIETPRADTADASSSRVRPRIRFGAIAWGLIVCAIAGAVLTVIGTPGARSAFASWLGSLTPGGYVLIGVLVLGGLILLWGLLGVIRRLQRQRSSRPIG